MTLTVDVTPRHCSAGARNAAAAKLPTSICTQFARATLLDSRDIGNPHVELSGYMREFALLGRDSAVDPDRSPNDPYSSKDRSAQLLLCVTDTSQTRSKTRM